MKNGILRMSIIGVLVAALIISSAAFAKKEASFEGTWFSVDLDGSNQWLWIENFFGVYELVLFDDMCSGCSGTFDEGPSCMVVGSGHISNPSTLKIDNGSLYCYWDEGVERLDGFNWETETFYYSETDTIKIHSVVWDRTKDKDPEKIIDPITYPKSSSEIPYATCGETVLALPYIVTIATMFSEARISEGYSCLQINSYLTDTAQNHADYLYLNGGELTRDEVEGLPGFTGTNWIERIIISGYPGSPALEFHAAGYDAESVAQAWLDNPANHQYLMDPTIGDMGVGYSGGNIWVADFGKP